MLLPASFHHAGIPTDCITPLIMTQPGAELYPGISSGTGFFAKRGGQVLMFTALHCLERTNPPVSFLQSVDVLTIPIRLCGHTMKSTDYVRFDNVTRLAEKDDPNIFYDIAALRVVPQSKSNHEHLLSRSASLPPSGLWLNRFSNLEQVQAAMDAGEPITFTVIGYPNSGTKTNVHYADGATTIPTLQTQPAKFTAHLRNSPLDNCLRLENSSWPHGHAGFSGSPVFVHWESELGKLSALVGMAICGSNDQLHFINVATLVGAASE